MRGRCEAVEALAGEGVLACLEETRLLSGWDVGEDEEATGMVSTLPGLWFRKTHTKAIGIVIIASTMKSHLYESISGARID